MRTDVADYAEQGRWQRVRRSLSAKLTVLLVASMAAVFSLVGYLNLRLHRQHLEAATLLSAERASDIIKRSASYCMLRNDREGLYHIITTISKKPGGRVRSRTGNDFHFDSAFGGE